MARITTQEGGMVLTQRIAAVTVHYWPQLREGDPDVIYDVMIHHTAGDTVGGRYLTLARAEEVRDALADAVDADLPYEVPAT